MGLYQRLRINENGIGQKYGRWTQLGPSFYLKINDSRPRRLVVVECECGLITVVVEEKLRHRQSTQCNRCSQRFGKRHRIGGGRKTHGKVGTTEYTCWAAIISRCENQNARDFHNYGGRGILVCKRWRKSFIAFLDDMGAKPSPKHQIDRIDNDGNYEPGNCHWVTAKQNRRNTRTNAYVDYNGRRISAAELHELLPHIGYRTIIRKLKAGWTGDEIAKAQLRPAQQREA